MRKNYNIGRKLRWIIKTTIKKKPLTDLAPLRIFLGRKYSRKEEKSVGERICYLKSRYLSHNEE